MWLDSSQDVLRRAQGPHGPMGSFPPEEGAWQGVCGGRGVPQHFGLPGSYPGNHRCWRGVYWRQPYIPSRSVKCCTLDICEEIRYPLRLLTERTYPRDNCTLDLSLFIRSLATLAFNVNESLGSFILLTFRIHKPRSYIGLWTRGDRNK